MVPPHHAHTPFLGLSGRIGVCDTELTQQLNKCTCLSQSEYFLISNYLMIVGPPTSLNYPPFAKPWPQSSPVIDLVFKRRKVFIGNGIPGSPVYRRLFLRALAVPFVILSLSCWMCHLISDFGSVDFNDVRDTNRRSSQRPNSSQVFSYLPPYRGHPETRGGSVHGHSPCPTANEHEGIQSPPAWQQGPHLKYKPSLQLPPMHTPH